MSDDLKERLANHPEAYSGGLCKEALARIEELEAQLATARADALREALNEVEETHTEASFFADKHGEEVLERVIGKILALIPEKDQ